MLCLKSYHYRKPKYLGEQPRGRITNTRWNDPGRVRGGNRRRSREKESTSFFLRRPARNRKREEKAIIRLVFSKRAAFSPPRCLFSSFSFIHTRTHTHTHTYLIQSPVLFIFPFSWPVGLDYDLLFHDSTPLPLYRRLPFPPRRPRVYCSIGRINTRTKRTFFLVLALAHSFIRSSTHLLSYSLAHFLSFFYSAGSSTMDRHFNPFLVRRTGRTHSRLACRH